MSKVELRPIDILLVEDDPADIRLVREALGDGRIQNRLYVVRDGVEALDYLHQRGDRAEPAANPRPGLIILDLNMPRKDGREVLAEIKSDPELVGIPVIVLTASVEESDILRSYNQEAASYMIKPFQIDEFMAVLREHGAYSMMIVENVAAGATIDQARNG
jgi:two-component system response regulator